MWGCWLHSSRAISLCSGMENRWCVWTVRAQRDRVTLRGVSSRGHARVPAQRQRSMLRPHSACEWCLRVEHDRFGGALPHCGASIVPCLRRFFWVAGVVIVPRGGNPDWGSACCRGRYLHEMQRWIHAAVEVVTQMEAPVDGCRDGQLQRYGGAVAFRRLRGHWCFSSGAGEHDGFQPVLARQDALTPEEAAPDRHNNAHLVLHPIEDLDWSSGSESQKIAEQSTNFISRQFMQGSGAISSSEMPLTFSGSGAREEHMRIVEFVHKHCVLRHIFLVFPGPCVLADSGDQQHRPQLPRNTRR